MFNFFIVKSLVFNFFPENPKFGQNANAYIQAPNRHETPKRFHNSILRGVTMSSRQNDPNNQPTALHKRANWENDQSHSSFGKIFVHALWRRACRLLSKCTLYDGVQICSTLCNDVQICCQRAKQNIWMLDSSTDVQFIRLSHHNLQKTTKQINRDGKK